MIHIIKMLKLLVVLVGLVAVSHGARHHPLFRSRAPRLDGRIVGGSAANIEDLPYQLSLQSYGSHICGASIISENWALTAAHCVYGSRPSEFSLRAGSSRRGSGGSVHQAAQLIVNPGYNGWDVDWDYALIRVETPFNLGQPGVQAIELASAEPSEGDAAVTSGWGRLSSGGSLPSQLQSVEVPVISRAECQRLYPRYDITDRMICAGLTEGGRDACQGDSGGPLASNGVLVGVVSWGIGCAEPASPGVYSNVANQLAWIRENAGL